MSAILKELSLFSDQAEDSPGVCIGPGSRQVASAMWESGLKHTFALSGASDSVSWDLWESARSK